MWKTRRLRARARECPAHTFCRLFVLGILVSGIVVAAAPVQAAVFKVTTGLDDIPPPPGSLRQAMELSQHNGQRDQILIRVQLVRLVATLPEISESNGVEISPDPASPIDVETIIDGQDMVDGAFAIHAGKNTISHLSFTGFIGPEVILIGSGAARGNVLDSLDFKRNPGPIPVASAAVRIEASQAGSMTPIGTLIEQCRFSGFHQGISIDGTGGVGSPIWADRTLIQRCLFGLDGAGGVTQGNGQAISILNHGPVEISFNSLGSTTEWGISLDSSNNSFVHDNALGVIPTGSLSCVGSSGDALRVLRSKNVLIEENTIRCSLHGMLLGTNTSSANVEMNTIGERDAITGTFSDGIVSDGAAGSVIRNNQIAHSGGAGIHVTSDPPPTLSTGFFSCNSIWGQAGKAIEQTPSAPTAPLLSGATPISVKVTINANVRGKTEVFGGEGGDALLYLGSTATEADVNLFQHKLPVTNLRVRGAAAGDVTQITFDGAYPTNLLGTFSARETSSSSQTTPANSTGLVFDVVRGRVSNLSRTSTGAVNLGPLTCLASGVGGNLPVPDFDPPPPPGESWFYLARRKGPDTTSQTGTYDPPICAVDLGSVFTGPRVPGVGDCPAQ